MENKTKQSQIEKTIRNMTVGLILTGGLVAIILGRRGWWGGQGQWSYCTHDEPSSSYSYYVHRPTHKGTGLSFPPLLILS